MTCFEFLWMTKLTFCCCCNALQASFGTFCVINIDGTLPQQQCKILPEEHVRRRKRRSLTTTHSQVGNYSPRFKNNKKQQQQDEDPNARNCIICLHYNSMLYMNFLGPREMIVVEQPWLQVVATFPEAVQRRVYGVH